MRSIWRPLAVEPPTAAADVWRALASGAEAARLGALGAFAGWPVMAGRAVFYLVAISVLTALWTKVAGERVAGALALPPGGFSLYVGATEWILLSVPSIHLRIEDDIRSGAIEAALLRPKPHLALRLGEALGDMLARMAVLGAVGLGLLLLSGARATPAGLILLALTGVGGGAIGVLLYAIAGLAGFWVRRTLPAYLVIQKLMFLMGGLFAPVSLYPGAFRAVCEASPFAAQLYWPASQIMSASPDAFAGTIVLQAVWIGVLGMLIAGLWRAGIGKSLREGT